MNLVASEYSSTVANADTIEDTHTFTIVLGWTLPLPGYVPVLASVTTYSLLPIVQLRYRYDICLCMHIWMDNSHMGYIGPLLLPHNNKKKKKEKRSILIPSIDFTLSHFTYLMAETGSKATTKTTNKICPHTHT